MHSSTRGRMADPNPKQLDFDDALKEDGAFLEVNSIRVPVSFRESKRARHYVIYIRRDGSVTVTIPRRGSRKGAQRFLESRRTWITRTLQRLQSRPIVPSVWQAGTEVLYRGRLISIRTEIRGADVAVWLEGNFCGLTGLGENLRPVVQQWLQKLAVVELPARVQELAAQHQSPIGRITIRNQRSRWGSCSRHGTISLNWRLVQLPEEVRDYIILHELAHLREMNHSRRFWKHVENVCPAYREHERWLKANGSILGL